MFTLRTLSFGALGAVAAMAPLTSATPRAITVDGEFDDWAGLAPVVDDRNDAPTIDIGRIWIADDERFLYLSVEFGQFIDLRTFNNLRLYIDTDNNPNTGLPIEGMGAELIWIFAEQRGVIYFDPNQPWTVFFNRVNFVALPSMRSNRFEMTFERNCMPNGMNLLFPSQTIKLLLRNENGGDRAPNVGLMSYTFDDGPPVPPPVATPLERECPGDLRLASWNIFNDRPIIGNGGAFKRLLCAIDPDIILFQEFYTSSTPQILGFVEEPSCSCNENELRDGTWHIARRIDCATVSRYPIDQTWPSDGNLIALIDATMSPLGSHVLVVNANLPTSASARQTEIDGLLQVLRMIRMDPIGQGVPPGTPVIIGGTLNLRDPNELAALLNGNIFNNGLFGPDFAPDWDDTALAELVPLQTELRFAYTQRNDADGPAFPWPARDDFLFYSDSVLRVPRTFMLYTPEMSMQTRSPFCLNPDDSLNSDHLPLVADLRLIPALPGDYTEDGLVDLADLGLMFGLWGSPCGDITGDGQTGVDDLGLLFSNWTRTGRERRYPARSLETPTIGAGSDSSQDAGG